MSYIRMSSTMLYVEGESQDYVYLSSRGVVDYGSISDKGFIELIGRYWDTEDPLKEHILKRLSERLGLKLNI